MKLVLNRGHVETSGDMVTTGFRIKTSQKMFRMLSDGLYSDKVRAIIRELGTNAADAHVAAGKREVPFTVHLPNNLEPWFSVSDEGTGLSDADMHGIYTTYGESNKTDSNEFTGALGLGSKSPFSYTDSFTVESRYNGTKTVYNAFINEEGVPSLARLTQEPTDESNGLTVQFPVKSSDFWEFREKAQETYKWFRVRPTVKGHASFTYPVRDYLRKTDSYAVNKASTYDSALVMGNVAYPVSTSDIRDLAQQERALLNWGVELYVKIGDVDMTANREALSYDKGTTAKIKELLTLAIRDLEKEVTKDIASKPTIWTARKALYEVQQSFREFNFKAVWGGKELYSYVQAKTGNETATIEKLSRKDRKGKFSMGRATADNLSADGTPVYLNDGMGTYAALRRMMEEGTEKAIYVVSGYSQQWLDDTGVGEVAIKASTLPRPARASYARGAAAKAKLYTLRSYSDNTPSDNWTPAEVEIDDGGVYVELSRFNVVVGDYSPDNCRTEHPRELRRTLEILEALGEGVTLYGIRPADKHRLGKSEGEWIHLKTHLEQVLEDAHAKYEEDAILALAHKRLSDRIDFAKYSKKQWQPGSKFGEYVATVAATKKANDKEAVNNYLRLRSYLGKGEPKEDNTLQTLKEEVYSKYPMLQFINWYGNGHDAAIADYVNLIDSK